MPVSSTIAISRRRCPNRDTRETPIGRSRRKFGKVTSIFTTTMIVLVLMLYPAYSGLLLAGESAGENRVAITLLPGVPGIAKASSDNGMFWVGIQMDIREDWHVYWRNPGDSGLPTTIRWEEHPFLEPGEIHWPAPRRFDEDGITTYGYSDHVTLLVPFRVRQDTAATQWQPGSVDVKPGTITADMNWLVCKDICIPESTRLSIRLDDSGQFEGYRHDFPERIEASLNRVPKPVDDWAARTVLAENRFVITLAPQTDNAVFPDTGDIYFYPDTQGIIEHTAPQEAVIRDDRLVLVIPASRYLRSRPEEITGVFSTGESWLRDRRVPNMVLTLSVSGFQDSK